MRLFRWTVLSALVALALGSCALDEVSVAGPRASVTDTPKPPDASGPADAGSAGPTDNVAFVVQGSLEAPDGSAAVEFTMTVGAPTKATSEQDTKAFTVETNCSPESFDLGLTKLVDPSFVHLTVEASVTRGGLSEGSEGWITGALYPVASSGDWLPGGAPCELTRIEPGRVEVVAAVESGVERGDSIHTHGWIPESGGYGVLFDIESSEGLRSFAPSRCEIEYGSAAGEIDGKLTQVDKDLGCSFGLADR